MGGVRNINKFWRMFVEYLQWAQGCGGTLKFSYIRRRGSFFEVQNLEFLYFWGFSVK